MAVVGKHTFRQLDIKEILGNIDGGHEITSPKDSSQADDLSK